MGVWERSQFAMSSTELQIQEAIVAMQRLLGDADLATPARHALEVALDALRQEQH